MEEQDDPGGEGDDAERERNGATSVQRVFRGRRGRAKAGARKEHTIAERREAVEASDDDAPVVEKVAAAAEEETSDE